MIIKKFMISIIISLGLLFTYSTYIASALMMQDSIISGIIWADDNDNETQELSELGIEGVKVYLQYQTTGELLETETGAGGEFAFLDLELGQYQLWYEYDGMISEIFDLKLDELNGIASLYLPMFEEGSIEIANVRGHHTVYLPIIMH